MVFDAHDRAFALFKVTCGRGIYDNMKAAVETVFVGKNRLYNHRFLHQRQGISTANDQHRACSMCMVARRSSPMERPFQVATMPIQSASKSVKLVQGSARTACAPSRLHNNQSRRGSGQGCRTRDPQQASGAPAHRLSRQPPAAGRQSPSVGPRQGKIRKKAGRLATNTVPQGYRVTTVMLPYRVSALSPPQRPPPKPPSPHLVERFTHTEVARRLRCNYADSNLELKPSAHSTASRERDRSHGDASGMAA